MSNYPDHVTVVDTDGECSRQHEGPCAGEVEERLSRAGFTAALICAKHRQELEARLDEIAERYPDTAQPPDWFDPTYAGETWDSDD